MRGETVAVGVVVTMALVAGVMQMRHAQNLEHQFNLVEERMNSELKLTKDQMGSELRRTQEQLSTTQGQLATTQEQLTTAQGQLSSTQEQLAAHVTASRNEMVDARRMMMDTGEKTTVIGNRLALVEERQTGPAHRSLQSADEEQICLDPTHIAVSAMDSAWALSKAFDGFIRSDYAGVLLQLTDVREAFAAVNASMFRAVGMVSVAIHTPAEEAAQAAALASDCEASTTDPATTCTPPPDGLVATGCSVASGTGTCTAVPHTCSTSPETCPMTALFQGKADVAALETKADMTTVTSLLEGKPDTSTMTSLLEDKADRSTVTALTNTVDD